MTGVFLKIRQATSFQGPGKDLEETSVKSSGKLLMSLLTNTKER